MLPDVELALTAWARATFSVATCTVLPADLAGVLPVVQIEVIGGSGTMFSAVPRVEVDVYAVNKEAATDLAARVHDALVLLRGTVGGIVVRDVRVDSVPARRPYDNTTLYRVGASYSVSARTTSYA